MRFGTTLRAGAVASALVLIASVVFGAGLTLLRAEAASQLGVDVSSWQGSSIDWQAAAGSGVSFAYIRAAEGSGYVDTAFRANWYRATAAGVIPGAYLYFHAAQDPVGQAYLLLQQLRGVKFTQGDLLPAIDVEVTDNQPASTIVTNLQIFVNTMVAATEAYPVIYTSPAWWDGHVGSPALIADPLWVANWGVSRPSLPAHGWGGNGWQVWQYSNKGSIPGIPGAVDLDRGGSGSLPLYGTAGLVPQQARVALSANNLADQGGDMDVVWRGTDSRLWTIGYRNYRWAMQATPISAANVVADPTVVSTGPKKLDAFWRGTDGNLWHVAYTGGWYGSGAWAAPESLGQGPLQSAPHAVAGAGGAVNVFWKNAGGGLSYLNRTGSGSPAVAVAGATLGGDPYPVAVGSGSIDIFWRDPGGNLWVDQLQSWGSGSPRQLGAGSLASDPTPVSAGDGNADVFWRGADSALWHLGLVGSSAGAAQVVATQPILGRPSAVEPTPGTITLVLQRSDAKLAAVLALPAIGWVGPELLGDGPVGSDPSSLASGPAINVFWRGQDGGLWASAACPGCAPAPLPSVSPLS